MCPFESPTPRLQLNHLRTVHSSDPRFSARCGIGGCSYSARSFSALYSHIYRNHRDAGITGSRGIEQLFQSSSDCTTSDPHSGWTNVSSWNLNPVYLVSDTYSLLIT